MRMATMRRRVMMLALCLSVQLSAGASAALSFTTASLQGRWTVHLEPATSFGGSALGNVAGVAAAPRQHFMRVGYIDWNGLGGATGRFIATTDTNSGQTMIIDYKWSGTYTVDTQGTGALTITAIEPAAPAPVCTPAAPPEGGACTDYIAPSPLSPVPAYMGSETFALVISKRYSTVSLVQQNNLVAGAAKIFLQGEAIRQFRTTTPYFFTSASLSKTWALRLEPATSFSAIDPAGGVAGAPRQDVMRVGSIAFTGFGLASGTMIATTDNNTGQTVIINYQWVGTYTMNSDGTGTLTMNPVVFDDTHCTPALLPGVCVTLEAPETYAFSLSKSRLLLYLTQTDNVGGGAKIFLRGAAQPQ